MPVEAVLATTTAVFSHVEELAFERVTERTLPDAAQSVGIGCILERPVGQCGPSQLGYLSRMGRKDASPWGAQKHGSSKNCPAERSAYGRHRTHRIDLHLELDQWQNRIARKRREWSTR